MDKKITKGVEIPRTPPIQRNRTKSKEDNRTFDIIANRTRSKSTEYLLRYGTEPVSPQSNAEGEISSIF